jgi:hypothetical protein
MSRLSLYVLSPGDPLVRRLLTVGIVIGVGLGETARSAVPARPPTKYSCEVETRMFRGRPNEALALASTTIDRVWQIDGAYRVESYQRPGSPVAQNIILNNGDGSDTEFLYHPEIKRAVVDVNSVRWKFAQKYPNVWRKKKGVPAARPELQLLRFFDGDAEIASSKKSNTTLEVDPPTTETIEGKRCRVYTMRYQELRDATGKTDPMSLHKKRVSVWPQLSLIMRDDTVSQFLGSAPPRPLVQRSVITIRKLELNPRVPPSRFEIPTGTTCEVFGDYPTTLPKGVIRKTIPGPGLDL